MTTVANIRDGIPPGSVYIGREGHGFDGYFGNPVTIGTRATKIAGFRDYFLRRVERDLAFRARVEALRGKILLCFCKPMPCHGDVIAEWLDR